MVHAVRLTSNPRFKEIKHYAQETSSGHNEHLTRLLTKQRASIPSGTFVTSAGSESLNFADVVEMEQKTPEREKLLQKMAGVEDRIEWQTCFDKSVTRLMIDFDLSHVPQCKMNHLDRMHSWFKEHGGKQERKTKKAPNYLVADRGSGNVPPGSTVNIPSKLSDTTLILAGSLHMGRLTTPRSSRPQTSA